MPAVHVCTPSCIHLKSLKLCVCVYFLLVQSVLGNVSIHLNVDSLEGGMDGLMQVLTCNEVCEQLYIESIHHMYPHTCTMRISTCVSIRRCMYIRTHALI